MQAGRRRLFALSRRSVSRVLRVLGRPAVRVGVLARRLFGVRVARDVNETSQSAAMANGNGNRRGGPAAPHARSAGGDGAARRRGGFAVARSSRVIAAGEATAQAIGPVPVAHPAVWTPGLCGSDRETLQRPGPAPLAPSPAKLPPTQRICHV